MMRVSHVLVQSKQKSGFGKGVGVGTGVGVGLGIGVGSMVGSGKGVEVDVGSITGSEVVGIGSRAIQACIGSLCALVHVSIVKGYIIIDNPMATNMSVSSILMFISLLL
jgi:hypothetical protein